MAATGIRQRHGNGRKRPASGCKCPWEAFVYSKRDGKKIREQFPARAAAKSWREDAQPQVRKKLMRAPTSTTLNEAASAWLDGPRAGLIRPASGEPYKPSAIRNYERPAPLRAARARPEATRGDRAHGPARPDRTGYSRRG